jgi:mono/diheme cytochrome c family protein
VRSGTTIVGPPGLQGPLPRQRIQQYSLGMVVAWWILLGMALTAAPQSPAVSGSARREAPYMFVRYCSACHGAHGQGDGPAASAFQPPPADLTRIRQRHDGFFPAAEVAAAIDGRTAIPAHGSRETIFKPSSNNDTRPVSVPLYARVRLERGVKGALCPYNGALPVAPGGQRRVGPGPVGRAGSGRTPGPPPGSRGHQSAPSAAR